MRKFSTLTCAIFASFLLAGCSFRPEIPNVDTKFEATYKFETSSISDQWWKEFKDENLNALIEGALQNNTNLRIAYLNLQKAQLSLGVARADLFPSVNLNSGASRTQSSGETASKQPRSTSDSLSVNLGLSYEIDLWGRVKNAVESAKATLKATKLDYDTARLSISSNVAKNYFTLVALNMREAVLKDTLNSYEETLKFRKTQLELGGIDEATYLQSRAAVEGAKVSLLEVQTQISQALTALAILSGKSNDEILNGAVNSAQKLPLEPKIDAGISADILLRRSDVAKAYADLNATNALVGVAEAEYFPSISLTGLLGFSSDELGRLFVSNAGTWSLGANLTQKIFNYGRTKNNVQITQTNEQIAAISYEAAVKTALGEVRDALNNRQNAKLTLDQVRQLLSSQEQIYALAKNKFDEGYTSHLELLDAQRNLLSTRLQAISAKLNVINAVVDVYKAFGGGFKDE